jgi:hypothetical protein
MPLVISGAAALAGPGHVALGAGDVARLEHHRVGPRPLQREGDVAQADGLQLLPGIIAGGLAPCQHPGGQGVEALGQAGGHQVGAGREVVGRRRVRDPRPPGDGPQADLRLGQGLDQFRRRRDQRRAHIGRS